MSKGISPLFILTLDICRLLTSVTLKNARYFDSLRRYSRYLSVQGDPSRRYRDSDIFPLKPRWHDTFLSPRGALKWYSEAGKVPLTKKIGIYYSSYSSYIIIKYTFKCFSILLHIMLLTHLFIQIKFISYNEFRYIAQ